MTDYAYILSKRYPGKQWVLNGDDYSGLQWLDQSPKPSKFVLDQEYINYKAANDYKELRRAAYPPIQDQLDMIYNLGIAGWKAEIKLIKDQYPKPGEV